MKFYTYILFSEKLNKHYIGQTNSIQNRLKRHNNKQEKYTKKGTPWVLLCAVEMETRADTMKLERKLKNFKSSERLKNWIKENT
jgi:putative endonuclease